MMSPQSYNKHHNDQNDQDFFLPLQTNMSSQLYNYSIKLNIVHAISLFHFHSSDHKYVLHLENPFSFFSNEKILKLQTS